MAKPSGEFQSIISAWDEIQNGKQAETENWSEMLSQVFLILKQAKSSIPRHVASHMRIAQSQALVRGSILHSKLVNLQVRNWSLK